MPSYISIGMNWYNLSDTPATAVTEVTAVQALNSAAPTLASINTQVQLTDATVVVKTNEYEMSGMSY